MAAACIPGPPKVDGERKTVVDTDDYGPWDD
jgi:hypothetical protein